MDNVFSHTLSVFMGFFAIMNPIANTPVFLGLTADYTSSTKRKIAIKALLLSFIIVVFFSAAGKLIFNIFGITLTAFRIMGGILVALVGYKMLHGGEHSSVQHPSEDDKLNSLNAELDVAISPLAMPILAGPGTIATAMNYATAGGIIEFFITIASFFILSLISFVFFISGERLVEYIGKNGIKVITRLMGLILAVIGVQMFINGIENIVIELQKTAG